MATKLKSQVIEKQYYTCALRRDASQTVTVGGTDVAVSWDNELLDRSGMFDLANPTQITIQKTGIYNIRAWLRWADSGATENQFGIRIYVNGSIVQEGFTNNDGAGRCAHGIDINYSLNSGDTIEIHLIKLATSGSSLTTIGTKYINCIVELL